MHSDWFNGIEIGLLQGRWQHGEKMGYCYTRGLEKILVTKGINRLFKYDPIIRSSGTKFRNVDKCFMRIAHQTAA
jgi:hypothetical protein